jgi:hypothetical protein
MEDKFVMQSQLHGSMRTGRGNLSDYALMKDIIKTAGRSDVYIEKSKRGYSQDQLAEDEGLRLSEAL